MKMIGPLEATEPTLFAAVNQATKDRRWKGVLFVCKTALEKWAIDDSLAFSTLAKLELGEVVSDFEAKAIKNQSEKLEEGYWKIQHAFDRDRIGTMEDCRHALNRFCAVESVALLAADQSASGIENAISMADNATSGDPTVQEHLLAILRGE